jgi:hypothetical protein
MPAGLAWDKQSKLKHIRGILRRFKRVDERIGSQPVPVTYAVMLKICRLRNGART